MRNFVKECRKAKALSVNDLSATSTLSPRCIVNMEKESDATHQPASKRKVIAGLGLPRWAIRFVFPAEDNEEVHPWVHHVAAQAEFCEENSKTRIMPKTASCEACKNSFFEHPSLSMLDALTRRIFECPRSDCGHPFAQDTE